MQGVTPVLGGKEEVASKASIHYFRKGFEFGILGDLPKGELVGWGLAAEEEGV